MQELSKTIFKLFSVKKEYKKLICLLTSAIHIFDKVLQQIIFPRTSLL